MSNKGSPLRLSASAVKAFLECPYRYAMDYVQRIPQHQRDPIPALAFGNAVHKTLARFIQKGGWDNLSCDDLLSLFVNSWDGSVYPDRDAEYRNFVRGKEMMERFHSAPYPTMTTKELGVELPVSWKKPHRGIVAVGKLDRVLLLNDGTLEVIDYKTGRNPSINLSSDTQALFYRTLAAEAFEELRPKSIRITFHYLFDPLPLRPNSNGNGSRSAGGTSKIPPRRSAMPGFRLTMGFRSGRPFLVAEIRDAGLARSENTAKRRGSD